MSSHPGTPREYLGPIKTDPDDIFIHKTEDLKNLDHFLEFLVGNGQMIGRLDALCSQHLTGRKTRSAMGIYHSEAWGAEAFPYYRCRPVGRLLNNLTSASSSRSLEPEHILNYRQTVNTDSGLLETSFDWKIGESRGHTDIIFIASQVDPNVMVLRFVDRVDSGSASRCAAVETVVPYEHRKIMKFGDEG